MFKSTPTLKRKGEDLIQLKLASEFKITLNTSKERMLEIANIAKSQGLVSKWEALMNKDSEFILKLWWNYFMMAKAVAQLWQNDQLNQTFDTSAAFENYAQSFAPPELALLKLNCTYFSKILDLEKLSKMRTSQIMMQQPMKEVPKREVENSLTSENVEDLDKTLSKKRYAASSLLKVGTILTRLSNSNERPEAGDEMPGKSDLSPDLSQEKTANQQQQLTIEKILSSPTKSKRRRIESIPVEPENAECTPWNTINLVNYADRVAMCIKLNHPNRKFGYCKVCERIYRE